MAMSKTSGARTKVVAIMGTSFVSQRRTCDLERGEKELAPRPPVPRSTPALARFKARSRGV
jgi:hypothetical protein